MSFYVHFLFLMVFCMLCQGGWSIMQDGDGQTCRPGEKGPPGQKGSKGEMGLFGIPGMDGKKGEKGSGCVCSGYNEIQTTLRKQEQMIKMAATGWRLYEYGSRQYWYKLSTSKSTHSSAKSGCRQMGGGLAAVGMRISSVRSQVIHDLAQPLGQAIWIGLDDLQRINRWMWIDGVTSTSSNTDWGKGEPNSSNERCGELYQEMAFKVNDAPCGHSYHYLCEKVV